ncbi:PIF-3 [Crangon crangon nudivirus]|uniref:PIF-3 n=1 Tax=Crangon crangon nudivirus TaxID=2880838 RepID=A0AAE8Y2G7_9VIRU|nr:PIF-3 [Crangon crangon nudivirus]UBZ25577.1 PIF-3 [Crangon crangon nudivirus]
MYNRNLYINTRPVPIRRKLATSVQSSDIIVKPPNNTWMILLCAIVILVLCYIIFLILTGTKIHVDLADMFKLETRLFGTTKKDCHTKTTYCFETKDCVSGCSGEGNDFTCMNGICRENDEVWSGVENICDPKTGFLGLLTGNTAFGTYKYICKSIDMGIATKVDEPNLMCKGQEPPLPIDYVVEYPTLNQCACSKNASCHVPATSNKREHIECNSVYYDLIHSKYV